MRIDAYTKFVLTVIALCLIWLSAGGPSLLPSVSAQVKYPPPYTSGYNRVVIAGWVDERNIEHPIPNRDGLQGVPVAVVSGGR